MAIQIKTTALLLEPIDPVDAPNGSLFLDSTNGDAPTIKGTGGGITPVVSADAALSIKQMVGGEAIPTKTPVAKLASGKIIAADSDRTNGQTVVGYTMAAVAAEDDLVSVLLVGANLVGALTGLGFTTGDEIYLAEAGGYTNDPNSFTGSNDTIFRVGIADCGAGVASGTAVDLIASAQIILRP